MKGCLSLIIKLIIAILVFYGLVHLGIVDMIKDKISEYNHPSQEKMIDKTKDIIDLSGIEDEYTIDKNLKILNNRMIIAEHNASEQKMIIIEPKDSALLTKDDIKSSNLQSILEESAKKYRYKLIKFNKIEVEKHGSMKGLGQDIPYAKVNVEISNLPVKNLEGIIGAATSQNGKNLIVISVNESGKYSQIITDAFYKQVK